MSFDPTLFCCPLCKGPLSFEEEAYFCRSCRRTYPVILDIPDFRVFPDPYIDYEEDRQKAKYLVEQSRDLDFQGMVRLYWKITPHVSEDRAERFIRHAIALVDKGVANLKEIEELTANRGQPGPRTILEIGCGTGGFLIAAKQRVERVVGVDIAFRWLVVARKRLDEAGLDIPLVCSCAENLPFKDGVFDLIVAEDVLEHVRQQDVTLNECYRVSSGDGVLFLSTPNRFSLTPEPHVRVWGVGFLPRRWMKPYVKLVKGISYDFIRVLSFPELRRLLRNSSFHDHQILLPAVTAGQVKDLSAFERAQASVYEVVRKTPLFRALLYLFGPFFLALCYARKDGGRGAAD